MAAVDFSRAIITPYAYTQLGSTSYTAVNPTGKGNVSLYGTNLWNANFGTVGSGSCSQILVDQTHLMYLYQGSFTQSGREFYLLNYSGSGYYSGSWKISNISFNAGDTYLFKIKATLYIN